jgi:hypothetical protein
MKVLQRLHSEQGGRLFFEHLRQIYVPQFRILRRRSGITAITTASETHLLKKGAAR